MKNPDNDILISIIGYCNIINDVVKRLGNSFDAFIDDIHLQITISFSICQIGEFAKRLSKEFIQENENRILFKIIVYLRNIIKHYYTSINLENVWKVVKYDIPELKEFCSDKLTNNQALLENNLNFNHIPTRFKL